MNKIIYLSLLLSYLWAICDEFYVEIDDNCYHEDDIEFLQDIIDTSYSPTGLFLYEAYNSSPPPVDLSPLYLGHQVWENNRLVEFCSSNSSSATTQCYSDYKLVVIPDVGESSKLRYLDLRYNLLRDGLVAYNELVNLEYLYLSNNIILDGLNIFTATALGYYPSLKEFHISNNNLYSIYISTSIEKDFCDFLEQLLSYNFNENYICAMDALSCVNIGEQNVETCCDGTEPLNEYGNYNYENYLGNCYDSDDLLILQGINPYFFLLNYNSNSIYNLYNFDFILNDNYRVIQLDLSNNQLPEIPNSIWSLNELKYLYLNNNSITIFPADSLNTLLNIQSVDLSSNLISDLDENYCEIYNGVNLNLSDNPICESENLLSCLENDVCFISDCTDSTACNYNQYATQDDGSCFYSEANYDCDNNCIINIDECGICGGDGILPGACDCQGTLPDEGYDCEGNQLSLDDIFPHQFEILDIFPNPFNPSTTISFSIDKYNKTTINIFSLEGVYIEQLLNEILSPGIYNVDWKPENLSNGIYLIVIDNGREKKSQKVTFLQ